MHALCNKSTASWQGDWYGDIPMTEDATRDVQTITIKDGMYSIDAMNTRSDIPDMNFEFVINRNQKKNY